MPIFADWYDDEQHIIFLRYEGDWTWNDFYETANKAVHPLLKSTTHTVYLIADFTSTTTIPMNGIMHARNVFKTMPTNWHNMIIVTPNKFIQILVDMFKKMNYQGMGEKIMCTNTLDEALLLIRTMQNESATDR
ncbi:MAG: hypothetical protein RLP44_01915 [Aggregatilineales bacterium]